MAAWEAADLDRSCGGADLDRSCGGDEERDHESTKVRKHETDEGDANVRGDPVRPRILITKARKYENTKGIKAMPRRERSG